MRHKRRNVGLLVYSGVRAGKAKAVKKLQLGGFVAYEKSYDWRDDPYEMALMRQDEQRKLNRAKAKAKAKPTKPTKPAKLGTFSLISGGLTAADEYANGMYQKEQQQYFDYVADNGADSHQAQVMHNNMVSKYKNIQNKNIAKKEMFEEASSTYDTIDNKETYSVSANGNVLVLTEKGPQALGIGEYLKSPEKYAVGTANDLMRWTKTLDTTTSTALIEEFLNEGAVGTIDVLKTYIDPYKDAITTEINKKMISVANELRAATEKKGGDTSAIDAAEAFKRVGQNMLVNSYDGLSTGTRDALGVVNKSMELAIVDVYDSILDLSQQRSRLIASLGAEVLKNSSQALQETPVAGRNAKYQQLIQQALFKKITSDVLNKTLEEGSVSTPVGSNTTGASAFAEKGKQKMTLATAAGLDLLDGKQASVYTMNSRRDGVKDKNNDVAVGGYRGPQVKGVISASAMDVIDSEGLTTVQAQNNKVITNTAIAEIARTDEIFTMSGDSIETILPRDQAELLKSRLLVSNTNPSGDFVVLPWKDGRVNAADFARLTDIQISSRQAYITAMKEVMGTDIGFTAEQIFEGRQDEPAISAAYNAWIALAEEDTYAEAIAAGNNKNATEEEKLKAKMATRASNSVMSVKDLVSTGFKGTTFKSFVKITGLVEDGDVGFEKAYNTHVKTLPGNFGAGAISEVTKKEGDYMEKVMKQDDFSWKGAVKDYRVKSTFFLPVMSTYQTAALGNVGTAEAQNLANINNFVIRGLSDSSAAGKTTTSNIRRMLTGN